MPPLPADIRPFVARARAEAPPVVSAPGELAPPFVAGAVRRGDGEATTEVEPGTNFGDGGSRGSEEEDLPWMSEAVSALAGLGGSGEDLLLPVAESVPDSEPVEDELGVEPWDDELGTFALSEELPEVIPAEERPELSPPARGAKADTLGFELQGGEEGEWPNYALPIVATPVPSAALEGVAQRLEKIARVLRERGPTGPLEENASDPLSALITGYVLGMSKGDGTGE